MKKPQKSCRGVVSLERTKILKKIATEYGIPPSTVQGRTKGRKLETEAYENNQAPSKCQEHLLESYLIFLTQKRLL